MDPDAGNITSVISVHTAERTGDLEKGDIEVEDKQRETPIPHGQTPIPQGGKEEEVQVHNGDVLPFSNARLISLVLTLSLAGFLNTLGVQAAVIILPSIGRALDIPDSREQWIVSAYSLAFGCFLLVFGRIADVYGKRLVFIAGSAWFTAVSIAIPFAPNEITFDVLRGLQGLGAAANVPTALGILGQTIPSGSIAKNYAFACYGGAAPLGSVFGNFVGGVVGQYATWKWVFWVMAIIAGAVTVIATFVIPPPPANLQRRGPKPSVDWIGGALITLGLLALMFALTEGNVVGWSTPWIPVVIVVSLLLVALFVLWQWWLERRPNGQPLMKISIFKNIKFSAAMFIMGLFFASFSNYLVFTTYYFQEYLGLSVIQTTLRFIPTGVAGIITAFCTGFLLSRIRGNYILMFGTLSVAISGLLYAVPISPETTYWAFGFPAMVLAVFGADTLYPTLTLFTAQTLPSTDQALGGALINAVGQTARAIGLAIGTAVETAVIAAEKDIDVSKVGSGGLVGIGDPALLKGLRAANWTDFALAVTAFLVVVVVFRGVGKVGAVRR